MSHVEYLQTLIQAVRQDGAAAALDQQLAAGLHHTKSSYFVWAVDRLVDAGLSDIEIIWHPLVDAHSPLAWYSEDVLSSEAARTGFVVADRALPSEPQPHVAAVCVR
jgi:hypothetical protein